MFWNMGQLPENWTVDMLQKKHSSIPYNPDIANAFFRSGYVEAWGRGIEKINENCVEAGLPLPLIYYNTGGCWVEFRKDIYNHDALKELGLNERQVKAVLYVKEKGRITNAEYQEINEISERTASRDLEELYKQGILERIGESKSTFYEIKNGGYGG
jgi:ATP-dependent DNA helicase RecG